MWDDAAVLSTKNIDNATINAIAFEVCPASYAAISSYNSYGYEEIWL
jgi:hypothetical protein